MKKICVVSHGLGSNGVDQFVRNLIIGLAAEGKWNISLIMALDSENSVQFFENDIRNIGTISIYRTNDIRGPYDVLRHFVNLRKLLKEIRPDVVHSSMSFLDGINCFAAVLAKIPVRVSHAHTVDSEKSRKIGTIYYWAMRRAIWKFANRHVGCSDVAMNYYYGPKWLKDKHSAVVFNGIDLKRFNGISKRDSIQKFQFDNKLLRVVVVGRLSEVKNPFFIVEVMKELCKLRQDCELVWVGSGPLEDAIKEKVSGGYISVC